MDAFGGLRLNDLDQCAPALHTVELALDPNWHHVSRELSRRQFDSPGIADTGSTIQSRTDCGKLLWQLALFITVLPRGYWRKGVPATVDRRFTTAVGRSSPRS